MDQNPNILDRPEMAKVDTVCGYVGQAKLQLFDLTPFGGLITAQLPAFKGSSVSYRVSAVTVTSMSCLFVRGIE